MEIRSLKATALINNVKNIRKIIKDDELGVSFNVPNQFIEKRNYMQSEAFLKDPHNIKMFELQDQLSNIQEQIISTANEAKTQLNIMS